MQQTAPGGLADPFAPLVGVEAADEQDPMTGLAMTGVFFGGRSETSHRDYLQRQRCDLSECRWPLWRDAPLLLPTEWSVLSIDVACGCIRFALNDELQDPLFIA